MAPRPMGPYYVIYGTSEDWQENDEGYEYLQSKDVWIIGITTEDRLHEHIAQVEERARGYIQIYTSPVNEFFEWQNADEIFK